MNANKIILNNEILIDLTQDTAIEEDVAEGKTFHKADGSIGVGNAKVGSEDLDDVLTEQETLLVELKATLNDKASGGGSGAECTLPHVIEVDELPTENIDTNAVYFCDGKYYKYVSSDDGDIWEEYILNDGSSGGGGSENREEQFRLYLGKKLVEADISDFSTVPSNAFENQKLLVNVNMDQVTIINSQAFSGCQNLALTELPSGLTRLDSYAFIGCSSLVLTELPSGITQIGNSAFQNCTSLALTKLPNEVTSIGDLAFSGCKNITLTELPSGLTSISDSTFYVCSKLTLTELPSGITQIGSSAFYSCSGITLTELPSGLTKIGDKGFSGCKNITLTKLPSSLMVIGSLAFYNCYGLTELTFKAKPSTLASDAFNGCTNLTTINVPWAEGEVANAPWGATNATINYNYTGE